LIDIALEPGTERTQAAVTEALEELICKRRQRLLLDLMGRLDWNAALEHKRERD
jgi:hypothetical protein